MPDAIPIHEVVELLSKLTLRDHTGDPHDDGYNAAISDVAKGLRVDDPVQALAAERGQKKDSADDRT
jgi:hypothetical protein